MRLRQTPRCFLFTHTFIYSLRCLLNVFHSVWPAVRAILEIKWKILLFLPWLYLKWSHQVFTSSAINALFVVSSFFFTVGKKKHLSIYWIWNSETWNRDFQASKKCHRGIVIKKRSKRGQVLFCILLEYGTTLLFRRFKIWCEISKTIRQLCLLHHESEMHQ